MSERERSVGPAFSAMSLVQSPSALRTLARLLGLALAGAVVALIVTPWQQTVTGTGRVAALAAFDRIQTIAAPVDGRVRQAWVAEGSRVELGDPILEIVDNDPSILQRLELQRAALESQLRSAEERLRVNDKQVAALDLARTLSIDAARSQVEVAVARTRAARHALEEARAMEEQAALNHERQRTLAEEGLVAELEFEVAQRVHREAQARLAQARQGVEAARNDEAARRSELERIGSQASAGIEAARGGRESAAVELAALRERLASLESRIAQQSTQRITAPRAGTVFRLYAAPGAELVKAGDPLVSLIPETSDRAVELWVDGNDVPLIEEGSPVRLQFEGWPAVQFSGWPSVAVGTFGGRVALIDSSDDGRGRFRLLVAPDPQDAPWPEPRFLRQGVRANGFVLLDRVSLGYELWRQANGFPPTVAMKGSSSAAATGGASS